MDTPYRGVERKNNSLWAISLHLPSMAVHLLWFSHWYSLMISLSTETTGHAAIWVKRKKMIITQSLRKTQIPPHIRWLQWTEVCVSKVQHLRWTKKFQAWGFSLTGSSHLHLSNYFWVPNHSHYYSFYTQAVMILVPNTEPSIHFHCMFLLPAFSQKHSTRYLLSPQFFCFFFGIPVVSDFGKGCHPAMIYRCSLGMLFFPRKLPNFYYIMVYAWFLRLSQECVLFKAPRQIWLLSRRGKHL